MENHEKTWNIMEIMENHGESYEEMDDLRVPPLFQKIPDQKDLTSTTRRHHSEAFPKELKIQARNFDCWIQAPKGFSASQKSAETNSVFHLSH